VNKKITKLLLSLLIFCSLIFQFSTSVLSRSQDQINADLAKIETEIAQIEAAVGPLKKETTDLSSKINTAKSQIAKLETQMKDLSSQLIDKEADLEVQKVLLSARVKRYYINLVLRVLVLSANILGINQSFLKTKIQLPTMLLILIP